MPSPTQGQQQDDGVPGPAHIPIVDCSAVCPDCFELCGMLTGHDGDHYCVNGHQWGHNVPPI